MAANTVPPDFSAEAAHAFASNNRAYLILLSFEIQGLPWEGEAKALLDNYLAQIVQQESPGRVVLFTGHRVDAPTRQSPRFPAPAESAAQAGIAAVLQGEREAGPVTGLAGGANGGDILFLEACRQLAIPFHMLLLLPEPQFIEESVNMPNTNWVERFQSLTKAAPPTVLGQSKQLPSWLAAKPDYSIWARNNLWMISTALALAPTHFTLMALWDGGVGDGPGGTEHMVNLAQQLGAKFIHLDTRDLLTRTVTQSPGLA